MLKTPHSIVLKYQLLNENYTTLKGIVEDILNQHVLRDNWHYLSRIKEMESFYYKLQTGRVKESKEDFLAGTIVVESINQISTAEELVTTFFDLIERRPQDKRITHNAPESFCFDDLRLYLTLKERDYRERLELKGLVFEIQIKTLLQHAWSVATHDLIYKPTDGTNWAMSRVAYQIKAMLEHAEVSIEQVKQISRSDFLAKEHKRTKKITDVENKLNELWTDGLGANAKRLSENILRLASLFECDVNSIFQWIEIDTQNGKGAKIQRYSPYEVALEAIIGHLHGGQHDSIASCISKNKDKIFVPKEFLEEHQNFSDIFSTID